MPQQTSWRWCRNHGRVFRAVGGYDRCPYGSDIEPCSPEWTRPAREREIPQPIVYLRSGHVIPPEAQAPLGRRAPQEAMRIVADSPYRWRPPEWDGVKRAPDRPPIIDRNGREHDPATGRMLPELNRECLPDEEMPELEVLAGLRRLWHSAPKHTRSALARLCGYRGEWALHSLRGVVKGRAALPEARRRHISRVLRAIERGQLQLLPTGQYHPDGKPRYRWRVTEEMALLIPIPPDRLPGRPRKRGDGGVAA